MTAAALISSGTTLASPPLYPLSDAELPVIRTDNLGIIANDKLERETTPVGLTAKTAQRRRGAGARRRVTYVSRHFVKEPRKDEQREDNSMETDKITKKGFDSALSADSEDVSIIATPPKTPAKSRVYYGLNVDELSSDSSLTDVPDDIGPDPFSPEPKSSLAGPGARQLKTKTKTNKSRRSTTSPYFPQANKHRPTFLATLPFPPLSHDKFGLMQERLAHDPFRLLIATIFLNKTPGERAMPVFYQLMSQYPTPTDLANAEVSDITSIIYELGFQNQRARKCVAMAKVWLESPPSRGKRYRKHNYPLKGDGRDVKQDEVVDDEDQRVAWEISHLPGLGPYSHDSWRMFCRDRLRGVAKSWNGEGADDPGTFEPEWKRVVPLDKELRAYLTWMWLKEGWVWNKETGKRTKASPELLSMAKGGGIVVEERDSAHLVIKSVQDENVDVLKEKRQVERTAGEYLPVNPSGES
ncbi:5-Methylcytosine G/T mismatch-specific DNA glycosylase [Fonsecaea pedrosoi]|nr:5-Methylcytosine G/T mismatch-specific DNA glycosylase [Fonsecaea pedrosoi]